MLNLKTEYSFKTVYGSVTSVAERCAELGFQAACISDLYNTYGHNPWTKACKKAGVKPVYGCTFNIMEDAQERVKLPGMGQVSLVAMTDTGLEILYRLVQKSYEPDRFYYVPRLSYGDVLSVSQGNDIISIGWGGIDWDKYDIGFRLYAPGMRQPKHDAIAGQFNLYTNVTDKQTWELFTGEFTATPRHIRSEEEWFAECTDNGAWVLGQEVLENANAKLYPAPMVSYPGKSPGELESMCINGAESRMIDLSQPVYAARLKRELDMIREKEFDDYFLIVADLVSFAKQHMLVGPSRGSSAGSLVCYLIGITEVDPIPFDLLFERFIDINRADLPDIDIDFPDSRREMVIQYLRDKYGADHVSHIGTVSTQQPRSAIKDFARGLNIPQYEVSEVIDAIIERSSGDARAAMCIEDTFTTTAPGQRFINKYPAMKLVYNIEGHARHSGVHAAGIIVSNEPIVKYAGIDARRDVAMLDKNEAEDVNLLKIDILGLKTLSIIQDCIDDIGMTPAELYALPLDDAETFDVFNRVELTGVFQFEGQALRLLTRQMGVQEFNDIAAISALARPGPLHNGGATQFIERRTGKAPIAYYSSHPAVVKYTKGELGTFIYQEQIMSIGREFGRLSWEDVSDLRKAMSKSYGEEFFNKYRDGFMAGAAEEGIPPDEARNVWENMITFGSWGFNKSHAVGYGMVSYWTAYLKAHHPLEFARANLSHNSDPSKVLSLLREFKFPYKAVDKDRSVTEWTVQDGTLIGPLTSVHGIGPKLAEDIVARRERGEALTPRQEKLLSEATTPYDVLYPAQEMFGEYYQEGTNLVKGGKVWKIIDVQGRGSYIFLGKLTDRNLRDHNELGATVRRGYEMTGPTLYLNLTLEDDTDSVLCTIRRNDYEQLGKSIAETGKVDEDWFIVAGDIIDNDWRKVYIKHIKELKYAAPSKIEHSQVAV